ncbi:hypothetical protein BLNAU_22972 [Blattamonas nauphoetae]|uniref:Uncharacterized protein n=1 Tax=Blattamonas nauphoetae TaxID=2049346 RepID=A0ABQ9WVP3_9EUKA|nr:hypothetical protein BLNAU_22972 [Blattamonas nauphoetae]
MSGIIADKGVIRRRMKNDTIEDSVKIPYGLPFIPYRVPIHPLQGPNPLQSPDPLQGTYMPKVEQAQ